jgi:hypothetical protein
MYILFHEKLIKKISLFVILNGEVLHKVKLKYFKWPSWKLLDHANSIGQFWVGYLTKSTHKSMQHRMK